MPEQVHPAEAASSRGRFGNRLKNDVPRWLLIAAPAVFLVAAGWHFRWTADDAFIDFRIVDNLLAGAGPVFNLGERVEAYTSPAWIGLLAFGGVLGRLLSLGTVRLEWVAASLGLIGSGAGLFLGSVGSARLWRAADRSGWLFPLGAVSIAAIAAFWEFATSGLECGLILAWLGLSFFGLSLLGDSTKAPPVVRLAILFGLGPLVRPDLMFESAVFCAVLLGTVAGSRKRLFTLAAAIALPTAYQIFRMGYFAALVPNTALAKEAGLSYWSAGFGYLSDFTRPYRLRFVFPILAAALLDLVWQALRNWRPRLALLAVAPGLAGIAHGIYIVRLGGDFMHARMLLPVFFDLALPVALVPLASLWELALALALLFWATFSVQSFRTPYKLWASGDAVIGNERAIYVMNAKKPNPVTLSDYDGFEWRNDGKRVRDQAESGNSGYGEDGVIHGSLTERWSGPARQVRLRPDTEESAIAYRPNLGLFGFGAGPRVFVCDSHGLSDPLGSRLRLTRRGKPGHEKSIGLEWCEGRRTLAEPAHAGKPAMPERPIRVALACGPIAELLDAIDRPLTLTRFLKNLTIAPRLTRLRFPAESAKALEELCPDRR